MRTAGILRGAWRAELTAWLRVLPLRIVLKALPIAGLLLAVQRPAALQAWIGCADQCWEGWCMGGAGNRTECLSWGGECTTGGPCES